jgi:hypothetical protein
LFTIELSAVAISFRKLQSERFCSRVAIAKQDPKHRRTFSLSRLARLPSPLMWKYKTGSMARKCSQSLFFIGLRGNRKFSKYIFLYLHFCSQNGYEATLPAQTHTHTHARTHAHTHTHTHTHTKSSIVSSYRLTNDNNFENTCV